MKRFTAILLTGMMIFTLASMWQKKHGYTDRACNRDTGCREGRDAYGNGSRDRGCKRNTADRNTTDRSAAGRTDCRTAGRGAGQFR